MHLTDEHEDLEKGTGDQHSIIGMKGARRRTRDISTSLEHVLDAEAKALETTLVAHARRVAAQSPPVRTIEDVRPDKAVHPRSAVW
jgi:hypothetical protein